MNILSFALPIFLYYWKPTSHLRESGLMKQIRAILNGKVCLTRISLRTGTAPLRVNHSYNKSPKPLTCSQELSFPGTLEKCIMFPITSLEDFSVNSMVMFLLITFNICNVYLKQWHLSLLTLFFTKWHLMWFPNNYMGKRSTRSLVHHNPWKEANFGRGQN